MPRLPDATVLGDRPIPNGRRPIVSDQSGTILSRGIDQLAGGILRASDQINQFATASARSDVLNADIEARRSLENDPDYQTYEKRYTEAMNKAREAAAKRIPDRISRTVFEQQSGLDFQRGLASVRQAATQREGDVSRSQLDETITANRSSALLAPDEATRRAFMVATEDAIKGAYEKGYLSAEDATNLQQSWSRSFAESFVGMQPLDTQLKMLSESRGTIADIIDPAKRVEMIDRAQRQKLAEEDQAWQMSERARRQMQDAASKDLDFALANGQLTPSWIEANRNRLSADDYRYAYKALEGESSTNIDLYADLRERASAGQDIRSEARKALTDRSISRGDYDRLLSEVESDRAGWYKRGAAYISTAAGVSDLNPDPAAAQRKAEMLDDWATWAEENPKATGAQAQDAYKRIVSEYAIVNYNNLTLIKRVPQFLVGNRSNPDFDATEDATIQALQDGRISQAEAEAQAKLIQEWRDVWQKTQQSPPK